jgi:hypothetical protein
MFITLLKTRNCNEKTKLDTWSKRTQTKPILPASAGKIALSEVEGPIQTTIRRRRIQHKDDTEGIMRNGDCINRFLHYVRLRRDSGRNDAGGVNSPQEGLTISIRDTFFSRRQCFSCLSRAIAEFLSEKVSKYSRLRILYFFEKCGAEPCLCS